jgi:hypothetical protein
VSDGRVVTGEPCTREVIRAGHQERAPGPPPAAPRWLAIVAVLGLTTLYVLTGPGNRSEADDAFGFAYDVEHGSWRILLGGGHTSHLLFLPLARGLYNLVGLFGDVRAYEAVRLANCLLAAAAVVLFASVLRKRFGLSRFAVLAGAVGLAVSYGFWRYANETEAYAVTVLGLVALCFVGFSGLRSTRAIAMAGVVAAVGTLIHILGMIPAIVVVPLVLLLRRRPRDVVVYFLAFALLTGAASYGAYRYASPEQSFTGYLFGQSPDASYSVRAVPQSVLSVGQDIATSNFLFVRSHIARRIVAAVPAQYLMEEQYAGERSDSIVRVVPMVTVPALLLLAAALVWLLRRRLLARDLSARAAVPLAAVLAWIAAYWLVVVGRSSSAPEAWIPLLPAVWTVIAVVVFERASTTRLHRVLVGVLLLVLVVHNLAGGFWMMHSRSTDLNAVKARWLLEHTAGGDVILTADGAVFERYLRYQAAAEVISLEGLSDDELADTYSAAIGQAERVFATAGVFDPPSQLDIVDQASFRAIQQFAASVRSDFRRVMESDVGDVYLRR